MPLDNTAKLPDIITALQTMEGINAKADLASVIGSPAVDTDTMATLVSLIQGAKNDLATKMGDGSAGAESLRELVGNLFVGKKWASGNATTNGFILTVTGMGFTPNVVLISHYSDEYLNKKVFVLFKVKTIGASTYRTYGFASAENGSGASGSISSGITSDGFSLTIQTNGTNAGVEWYAYE